MLLNPAPADLEGMSNQIYEYSPGCVVPILTVIRDGFCLFYDAKTKEVKGLNGSGRSPEKLTLDYVRQRGITGPRIPSHDLNSVTVPGMLNSAGCKQILTPISGCAGLWVDTVDVLGTLNIADVLEPAIKLAEGGLVLFAIYISAIASRKLASRVPVSEIHSGVVCCSAAHLRQWVNIKVLVAEIREEDQGGIHRRERDAPQRIRSTSWAAHEIPHPCAVFP
jgi:hypothetical protein